MNCAWCYGPFQPRQNRQKCCSPACSLQYDRRMARNRHRAKRPPIEFNCARCGQHVVSIVPDRRRRYCSWICHRLKNPHRDMSPRPCAYCAHIFTPKRGHPRRTYCSNQCHNDAANERRNPIPLLLQPLADRVLPAPYLNAIQALRIAQKEARSRG